MAGDNALIPMEVVGVRVELPSNQPIVLLKERDGTRYLPIWIGANEATSIATAMEGVEPPRPLTHDLIQTIIGNLGAKITHIWVNDLKSDTFFAKICVAVNGKKMEIDSRPSDAIALAVRAQVPIYAEDTVLEQAGVQLDAETGKPIIPDEAEGNAEKTSKVREEELQRLSAFTDFINTLDLEDFGKPSKE